MKLQKEYSNLLNEHDLFKEEIKVLCTKLTIAEGKVLSIKAKLDVEKTKVQQYELRERKVTKEHRNGTPLSKNEVSKPGL